MRHEVKIIITVVVIMISLLQKYQHDEEKLGKSKIVNNSWTIIKLNNY